MVEHQKWLIRVSHNVQFTLRFDDLGVRISTIQSSIVYQKLLLSAIAFLLAIFTFSFRHFKINAQNLVILTFLVTSSLLCLWIVLEISGWAKVKNPLKKLLVRFGVLKDTESDRPPNIIRRATLTFGSVVKAIKFIGIVRRAMGRGGTVNLQNHGVGQAEA